MDPDAGNVKVDDTAGPAANSAVGPVQTRAVPTTSTEAAKALEGTAPIVINGNVVHINEIVASAPSGQVNEALANAEKKAEESDNVELALGAAFGFRRDPRPGHEDEKLFYKLAVNFESTKDKVKKAFGQPPKNEPPGYVFPWEMRIGGSNFMVPPINVNVRTAFKAGSMGAGALRQTSSPKFNSGYSETTIEVTLYFPSHESIWGFADPEKFEIDFNDQSEGNFIIIDKYLSSLRGLITQFRYAPFLPVRNQYLNNVHGITGVALQSMTVANVPGYPFCMAVNLTMLKFNHKVYLPMIEHFDNAVHWGKFRQYMGRAAARMSRLASKNFLTQADIPVDKNQQPVGTLSGSTVVSPQDILKLDKADDIINSLDDEDLGPKRTFNKKEEITGGLDYSIGVASHFELYYPYHDPARIDLPTLKDFNPTPSEGGTKGRDWWQSLLSHIGINVDTGSFVDADTANGFAAKYGKADNLSEEWKFLMAATHVTKVAVELWSNDKFEAYVKERIAGNPAMKGASQGTLDNYKATIREVWFGALYHFFLLDPLIVQKLAYQDLKRKQIFIQEWEVPMQKVGLSDAGVREYVKVQAVSVSMGNNIARMQVQMQQEPTHQHIGGLDTTCQISMLVYGEGPIVRMRRAFEVLSGLARIEHQHGVLGFLGIKNAITALCGMRYCMISGFEVDTVPNYPHIYEVRLTLTDFDIFQQKREVLSAEQQAELILAFKTKKNPFLRVKQLWGSFNAYPDFPLAVKSQEKGHEGEVVGNLDPDFYFKSFAMMEKDIFDLYSEDDPDKTDEKRHGRADNGFEFLREDGVHWSLGKYNDPLGDWLSTTKNGVSIREGREMILQDGQWREMLPENVHFAPEVPTLTPAGGPNGYIFPHGTYAKDPMKHYHEMLADTRYRDKTGRMIRAFPTFMLWLINEQGMFAGIKLFDNFYGLQSVIDFSVNASEDIMGDTLVLRISNLYSRLSTPFGDIIDNRYSNTATIFNAFNDQSRRLMTGLNDYLVKLDTVEIAPGARVHLRMGYSSNPNAMDIVFNGVVTQVEQGEILTLTCQSDAIELGAMVNTTNTKGHSGKIDGDMVGFYMSEPRDLMIQLLTMGSSVFKEVFANATQGKVFSENRFGIRHFGTVLYESMTDEERDGKRARRSFVSGLIGAMTVTGSAGSLVNSAGNLAGMLNPAIGDITTDLWTNLSLRGDYELFKRNIYPGNGTGVAQYMGGDLGEGALNVAMLPTGVDAEGKVRNPYTGESMAVGLDPLQVIQDSLQIQGEAGAQRDTVMDLLGSQYGYTQLHTFAKAMGIVSHGDDDMRGFDEVSFRASTYMKTVWDLFQVCAALLPNYIVAVRPFEDRSTVFYGKPHWTYTSGVIPLTTGPGLVRDADGKTVEIGPSYEEADKEWRDLYDKLTEELGQDRQKEDFYSKLSGVISLDPTTSTAGLAWEGEDPTSLPVIDQKNPKAKLANGTKNTIVDMGLHLPVAPTREKDDELHVQIPGLPPDRAHPFYMDKAGDTTTFYSGVNSEGGEESGEVTGEFSQGGQGDKLNDYAKDGTIFAGDESPWAGVEGAFGTFQEDPKEETYYIAQAWTEQEIPELKHARIMVWSPRTGRACICAPGDVVRGPPVGGLPGVPATTGLSTRTVLSPDTMYTLGVQPGKDEVFLGFIDREKYAKSLGPVDFSKYVVPGTEKIPLFIGPKFDANLPLFAFEPGSPKLKDDVKAVLDRSRAAVDAGASATLDFMEGATGDPIKYAFENGWKAGSKVPVRIDPSSGWIDEAGQKALLLFNDVDRDDNANEIWKEFRANFRNEKLVREAFFATWPGTRHVNAAPVVGITDVQVGASGHDVGNILATGAQESPQASDDADALNATHIQNYSAYGPEFQKALIDRYIAFRAKWGIKDAEGHWVGNPAMGHKYIPWDFKQEAGQLLRERTGMEHDSGANVSQKAIEVANAPSETGDKIFNDVMDEFMKFMWQNPYHRGWVVRTADTQVHAGSAIVRSIVEGAATGALAGFGVGAVTTGGVFSLPAAVVGGLTGAAGAGVVGVSKSVLEAVGLDWWHHDDNDPNKVDEGKSKNWNFHMAHQVWQIYISVGGGRNGASTWMQENKGAGKDQNSIFGRLVEETYEKAVKPALDLTKQIATVLGGVASSVAAFVKLSMMQMTMGVGMKTDMQRRTNMLNRVYNDSIYYKAGSLDRDRKPNILRLADNPFTREYGEPVVEIREPFQRIHYLSSFNNVLKNAIIENTEDVATVVTAVSNGKHPITVHYDKGAAPEYQREKVVDTGLLWDQLPGIPIIKSIPVLGKIVSPIISTIFHPVTAVRGIMKDVMGSGDEISSKRVALHHLREGLKDIYTGEIFIIGDASIRPHDLIYLADVYERMYGFFEVESVTHHFTPETGFITGVVPNAVVTVNDPARWTMMGFISSRFAIMRLRQYMQHALNVRADNNSSVQMETAYSQDDILDIMNQQVMDSNQYSGGVTSIVKDVGAATAVGILVPMGILKLAGKSIFGVAGLGGIIGGNMIWGAFNWVRDNLLDQHGCSIQYLTHNGQPMDAGLSPNSSTAVGRQHGLTMMIKGLQIASLTTTSDTPQKDPVTGKEIHSTKITTSELLSHLGYTPTETEELNKQTSMFLDQTLVELGAAMRNSDPIPGNYEVLWVRVVSVKDGDTVWVEPVDPTSMKYSKEIRFLIAGAPEDHLSDKDNFGNQPNLGENYKTGQVPNDPGLRSTRYVRARMLGIGPYAGFVNNITNYKSEIALRINKDNYLDPFGRTLAFLFHQGLPGQSAEDRKKWIMHAANIGTGWQEYTSFGQPYTLNQEIMALGYAGVEADHLSRSLPGQGVLRAGR